MNEIDREKISYSINSKSNQQREIQGPKKSYYSEKNREKLGNDYDKNFTFSNSVMLLSIFPILFIQTSSFLLCLLLF